MYTAVSIAIEVALLTLGLRIPADNLLIAPAVLGIAPVASALIAGQRGRAMPRLALVTAIATLLLSIALGTATGLLAPLLVRSLAASVGLAVAARRLRWTHGQIAG